MAEKKKSKKTADKWKAKRWYKVLAPEKYQSKEIGEVVAADDKLLKDRILRVNLAELTGKMSQATMYTNLLFRITEVKGGIAHTELIGHSLSPGYIRTLARRRRTLLHSVMDVATKDEREVRLKLIAATKSKISETMRKNLRGVIEGEMKAASTDYDYYGLMEEIVNGRLATRIFNKARMITPMSRVEFKSTELKEKFE